MVASDMVMPCGSASIGMFYAWKNWWKRGEMVSQISSDVYGVGLISAGPGTC